MGKKRGDEAGGASGRVTIYSVAERAGVSRQTVSNVLNFPERVSPQLQAAVNQAIEETGYRPSAMARSLALSRTGLVAFRVGDGKQNEASLLDPFMRELARIGVRHGARLVLDYVREDDEAQMASYADLVARRAVDGIIITQTHTSDRRPSWLVEHRVPFVAFGRPWADPDACHSWVDVDVHAGVGAAVKHLAARGHRRIAYIGAPFDGGQRQERSLGWHDAMRGLFGPGRDGPPWWESLALHGELVSIGPALDQFLDDAKPTAFTCQNDLFGDEVMRRAVRHGLTPGRDLAVVGFDDSLVARRAQPPMSSVAQPITQIAELAWQALLPQIRGEDVSPIQTLLPPALITRESSEFYLA